MGPPAVSASGLTPQVLNGLSAHWKVSIEGAQIGWINPDRVAALHGLPGWHLMDDDGIALEPSAIGDLTRVLVTRGLLGDRAELFDVRAVPDGQVLAPIDRVALPMFGIAADGVHPNGLVRRSDGPWFWVALFRRQQVGRSR